MTFILFWFKDYSWLYGRQHFLYFLPLLQGHLALGLTFLVPVFVPICSAFVHLQWHALLLAQ